MSAADHLQPEQFEDMEMHMALSDLAHAIYAHLPEGPHKTSLVGAAMGAAGAAVKKIPERYGKS